MLTIIGCGNLNRSDDAVGAVVAQRLLEHLAAAPRADVRVFDAGTAGVEVMFMARGSDALVIVDACRSGGEPGAIFDVPGEQFDTAHAPAMTLHDFRWDHALHAGRRIFKEAFPKAVSVYLIEVASVALGLGLSAPVAAAAELLVERLAARIDAYRGPVDVRVERGQIYLDAEVVARCYPDIEAVALIERDGAAWIVPVRGGGGLILKQRNARGDRVVQALEFLRQRDFDRDEPRHVRARWDADWAALVIELGALGAR